MSDVNKTSPLRPAEYELADVTAIQQLAKGEASPEMQVRALRWIVEDLARTYDLEYRSDSERDSCFAGGKRYVGLQIVKMTKLNTSALLEKEKNKNG